MSNYSSFKVIELKELLKSRDLSVSGTKTELIARLVENDSATNDASNGSAAALEDNAESVAPTTTATTNTVAAPTEDSTIETSNQDIAEATTDKTEATTDQTDQTDAKSDATAAAIADLTKRIARANRFGLPSEALQARLEKIQKFGLDSKDDSEYLSIAQGKKTNGGAEKKREPEPIEAVDEAELERRRKRKERFGS